MIQKNQSGSSHLVLVLTLVVLFLIGAVGWLVYERQQNDTQADNSGVVEKPSDSHKATEAESETPEPEADYREVDGIKYNDITGWENGGKPYDGYNGDNHYFISSDYKEAGLGQHSIESGAYISFSQLSWADISMETSVEDAAIIVRNSEGGYLDRSSVTVENVGSKKVVMFDSGHTTDGVTVFHKSDEGVWLEASFTTTTSKEPGYNAQSSKHYGTFEQWLKDFVELN